MNYLSLYIDELIW